MLHRNEYPTVERVDQLEEGTRCDSIGPHNEFWFISVIANAAFSPLSSLQRPGPAGGAGEFCSFRILKGSPTPPTTLLPHPFIIVYPRGISGFLGLVLFCREVTGTQM